MKVNSVFINSLPNLKTSNHLCMDAFKLSTDSAQAGGSTDVPTKWLISEGDGSHSEMLMMSHVGRDQL